MLASKEIYQLAEIAMQGMQLLFLSFSRDNEREADRLGVEYSTKVGYDSREMANFFNVLNKMQMESSHAGVPTFMSTHPDPGDRYNSVNKTSDEWQTKLNLGSYTVNKNSYLGMIDGMVYGEDPRQGFVENSVFYHPDLKFKFPIPKDWTLVNSPLQVQITPPNKNAVMVFSPSKEKTPEEALQKVLDELGLSVVKSKKTEVNGYKALAAISEQATQNSGVIKLLSYFIEKDGLIYIFHGVSGGNDFEYYQPVFVSTMGNFASLTDKTKINIKPDRIKIIKINSTTVSLENAFNYYKVPQDKYDEMALLNNMELNHTLTRGDLIKVIGK
jgi:predicted Zn-dependent protease